MARLRREVSLPFFSSLGKLDTGWYSSEYAIDQAYLKVQFVSYTIYVWSVVPWNSANSIFT